MITFEDKTRLGPTPIWLTPMHDALLRNAESVIEDDYCLNGCRHHRAHARCFECASFDVPVGSYIVCDGYEDVVAS